MLTSERAAKALREVLELKNFVKSAKVDTSKSKHPKTMQNMFHYLKLRERDNTGLQDELTKLGLSSLGRSQPYVLKTLDLIAEILSKCNDIPYEKDDEAISIEEAEDMMQKRVSIFGESHTKRGDTKIMLTLPSEAAEDTSMIAKFANVGVNIFRINTAHDTPKEWAIMADKIKELNEELPLHDSLKIYVDLAGPKIRTGKIRKIKQEIKLLPSRAVYIASINSDVTNPANSDIIRVEEKFFKKLLKVKELKLFSRSAKNRTLEIKEIKKDFVICKLNKKVKLDDFSVLCIEKKEKTFYSEIFGLPESIEEIRLYEWDNIFLSLSEMEGHGKLVDDDGVLVKHPSIFCTQQEFVKDAKIGDKVFIDDGKIGLLVKEKSKEGLLCEIYQAKSKGETLKEEKGINFPDSKIYVDAITKEDIKNLDFVLEFADMVGISFAQSERDIIVLKDILKAKEKEHIGIVAKIETKLAVYNLPSILEALMHHDSSAIMLARGDLAIDVGFENMSYLQEEILDLCEAAHTPVIFATQVLENQMKNNIPSRAEITDAAFAQRADCVMLNKGAFAINTIKKLDFILEKMHTVFNKNRLLLGVCDVWKNV
jgi:pyruvate kinase